MGQRSRSSFGPGAYVVRYAWWSPLVPTVVGAVLVAGFVIGELRRPANARWRPDAHPGIDDWVNFGARCLMPLAGLGLFVLAAVYLRRVVRGRVAFAVARKGVYWCPSGDGSTGEWFSWDDVAAIEFHAAEGGSTGHGAVALRGYAPPDEERPRLVSTRLGGWRIGRRRLVRALREFAPHVEVIS
ncbi:hypothetical protein [Actinoallomurus rhizosphaericola]|uniref:hypothetical protein n=1 Tax=Actinoallomurus rhizosphaericola TaxID=2952536 RepID=UPI00209135AC|nr:hypothetical protein [Actinoallomurus rhizosphaericola]MCO5992643.1 hypothetical protein [Actinoallomurus rhizosphaericola]